MYRDKIQERISKYDNQLIYISGYKNCKSKIKVKCLRCGNEFERIYNNVVHKEKGRKYHCPICQTKIGRVRSKKNKYIKPLEEREKHFIDTISNNQPNIKYISGFVDNKSKVLVECNTCGYRFEITVDRLMRKNIKIQCNECKKKETAKQKEIDIQIKKLLREQRLYLNRLERNKRKETYNLLKKNTIYILKCKCCNDVIYSHCKTKRICNHCVSKVKKTHSTKSLKELYKRDKGICYICGTKCDYEDYTYRGNTFIAGNYYPSIDHVIPLNKGGKDEWNNLKLAHRICNSLKRDKVFD